jgi:tetratricopeptide (TPR) repeat protein
LKDSKLYTIIEALKGSQIHLIEKQLKEDKRKTLLVLFQLMQKSGAAFFDKEVLFYKTFKKKYSSANDYILRNEMRLLVEKIESVLLKEQIEKLTEKDILFRLKQQLLLYKNLDLFEIYEECWKEAKTAALEQYQYQDLLELNADYYEFAQFHIRNYKERLEIFEKLINENILYSNYFFAQQLAYLYLIEGNANKLRLEYQTEQTAKIPDKKISIELKQFNSYINEYYRLIGKWFPLQSNGKTSILLDALNTLEKCNKNSLLYKKEQLRVLHLIATDFSMSADFENANTYFEKLFNEIPAAQLQNKAYYLYNYALNLTKLNQYEKALTIISDAEKILKPDNEFLRDKYQLLKVVCYMFTSNTDMLKKMIPTDFSVLLPEQRVYFRFVNSIYHIINKEYYLASEEINNLLRSKLINEIDIHFLSVARFFKDAILEIIKADTLHLPEKALKKITDQASSIDTTEPPIITNYMPYKWLKSALKI